MQWKTDWQALLDTPTDSEPSQNPALFVCLSARSPFVSRFSRDRGPVFKKPGTRYIQLKTRMKYENGILRAKYPGFNVKSPKKWLETGFFV